ncbi:sorbosone dehydrogenase family protein [Yimella sp. cx-51]|uniref:PQQ-dependent sugar dehydrogenase n=1 Tax=Yimella sp. cx-51 TaxID=2770551 RepID=UPI00165E52E4|nr:PQQ-dependent sugar dehydrogenase [Yimella sp. cx-51]MBC9956110.1 PQQ-dependent sugar dehydrogenase [Yimella sp. cx-51]MBD2758276.1 PQQ-dependent sugar dehydrogenase [Yimella sp. cx-573]QTH37360.1 PQQ-dependent sugar dehydrogenase [Yimella sp. cx-51]
MFARVAAAALCAGLLVSGCSGGSSPDSTSGPSTASTDAVRLQVETIASGLTNPWDIAFLPNGKALVTQRDGALTLLSSLAPGARTTPVAASFDDLNARGEGGLMGLTLLPDFRTSRRFITCQTHQSSDIRLVLWRLEPGEATATRIRDVVTGLPVASSGRHSGCRMLIGPDNMLYVGTGDAANAAAPQDRTSLGGKVLRIDPRTWQAPSDNPFASSGNPREQLVWTYGHRNVQGLAVQAGRVYSAEHGPDKNDELNLLRKGANHGWDPRRGGQERDYDESVPMTDRERFPDAVPALWSSGDMTEAICAATFVEGRQWGAWEGALVVTALKGAKLMVLTLDGAGTKVTSVAVPRAVADKYGRLRAARQGPDGALYVTTSNGQDDKVLRIRPAD